MRTRSRSTVAAALAAALLLTPATAGAAFGPMPIDSPVPVPEGEPFALAGGLSPTTPAVAPGGFSIPGDGERTVVVPRVVGGAPPQLVVRRLDPTTSAPLGGDVVLSDAGSAPAGADAATAAVYVRPAMVPGIPATPPQPGQPAPPSPPQPVQPPGHWLVVWVATDGLGERVVGRRMSERGAPVGAPFTLSETTYVAIDEVAVEVVEEDLRAFVLWRGERVQDAGRSHVVVQGWQLGGNVAPHAMRVSSPDGDALGSLGVDYNPFEPDRHLVVWRGTDPQLDAPDEQEVLGRVLASDGVPTGGVLRLSRVGADGDLDARPVDAAVDAAGWPRGAAWTVAWSQAPAGDAGVRLLDANGDGAVATAVAPTGLGPGDALGGVAVTPFGNGGHGLAYDVGTASGARRVQLQPLQASGAATGAPIALSTPGQDARLPLFVQPAYGCQKLVLWRSGPGSADALGRYLWEPGCQQPSTGLLGPLPGRVPTPVARPRPRVAPRPRTYGPLRLRGVALTSHRLRPGRTTLLRFRVTAPATVVVSLRPAPGARSARDGRPLPRLRPVAATLRRVIAREPQRVVVRIAARDGRGRALVPGRYRVVLTATSPQRVRPLVARVPLRVVGR